MKTVELLERIFEIKRLLTPPTQNDPKPALSKRAQKRRAAKAEANEAEGQKSKKTVDEDKIAANRAEGQKQSSTLQDEILKEKGEPGLEYLKKILDSNYNINPEDDELIANLPPFCNAQLFRKLLPLCRLAFLYEDNGIAEVHATKLATIFNDEEGVFQYLIRFEKLTPRAHLLHDGCLFELPEAGNCNFEYWKRKSLQKGTNGINLLNPRFRKLLPYAPEIESLLRERSGQENVAQLEIDGIKKDISAIGKKYKKVEQTPIPNPTEEQKNKRREELSKLSEERSNLLLKLAECFSGLSLEETDLIIWDAFYELYQSKKKGDAYKILTKHGISPRNQDLFFKLEPNNDDIKVPNILINGADIDHKELYLKKLDIMTTEGRAIAACLGKITSCCQFLGGQGHDCTVHGIKSSDDGFYVLCRGDASKPQLNDIIIAQTWAWRGENGTLVLDSIEVTPSLNEIDKNKVIDIFRFFALELCSNPNFVHYNIHTVNTGSRSGITREVACQHYSAQKEFHQGYHDYSDSMIQLMLGNSDFPYLFYGVQSSALLKNKIEAATNVFLKENLSLAIPFKENQHIQGAISFAISTNSELFLETLRNHAGDRRQELEVLIATNRQYIINLNKGIIDFDSLKKGAYINAKDQNGQNGLLVSIENDNTDAAKELIALNIDVNATDKTGNKALPFAFNKLYRYWYSQEVKTTWFSILSKKLDLNAKNNNGYTPLGIALLNNDIKMIELLLAQGANIDLVQGPSCKSPIQLAIEKGSKDVFHLLLQQGAKLDIVDSVGTTLLMSAILSDNGELEDIIKILLEKCDTSLYRDRYGKTTLHHCLEKDRLKYIPLIAESLQSGDLLRLLRMRNHKGNSLLYQCIDIDAQNMKENTDLKFLLNLFDRIKADEFVQAVMFEEKLLLSYVPLICAVAKTSPKTFSLLLSKALALNNTKALREIFLSEKTMRFLFGWGLSIEVYRTIFDMLPKDILKELRTQSDKSGGFILHHIAKDPCLLEKYLSLYDSEEDKAKAVRIKNDSNRSVLFFSVGNLDSFNIVLRLYQNNSDVTVIEDASILAVAVSNPVVFYKILDLYPDSESRGKALRTLLQEGYSYNYSFWSDIEEAPEIFQCILQSHTEKDGARINQRKVRELIAHIYLSTKVVTPFLEELLMQLFAILPEEDIFNFLASEVNAGSLKGSKSLLNILLGEFETKEIELVLKTLPVKHHYNILIHALKMMPNNKNRLRIMQDFKLVFNALSIEEHACVIKELSFDKLNSFENINSYMQLYADNINSKIETISDIAPLSQLDIYRRYVHPYIENKLIGLMRNDEESFNEILKYLPVSFLCDYIKGNGFNFNLASAKIAVIDRLLDHCDDSVEKISIIREMNAFFRPLSIEDVASVITKLSPDRSLVLYYLQQYSNDIKLVINNDVDISTLFESIEKIDSECKILLYEKINDKLIAIISEHNTITGILDAEIKGKLVNDIKSFVKDFVRLYKQDRLSRNFSFFRSNFPAQLLTTQYDPDSFHCLKSPDKINEDFIHDFLKIKSHAKEGKEHEDSRTRDCLIKMKEKVH